MTLIEAELAVLAALATGAFSCRKALSGQEVGEGLYTNVNKPRSSHVVLLYAPHGRRSYSRTLQFPEVGG